MTKKLKVTAKKTLVTKKAKLSDKDILDAFAKISNAITTLSEKVDGLTESEVVPVNTKDTAVKYTKTTAKQSVKEVVSAVKARYELWSYDEYNQGSIITSGTNLPKIIDAAKKNVTEANVDNALAAGEKDKSWEAYFPQVFIDGEESTEVLYAGNKKDGKHYVYVLGPDKWELRKPDSSVQFKFYLGQTSNGRVKSDWYLKDHRGKEITSLTDQNLERKTALFVKVV